MFPINPSLDVWLATEYGDAMGAIRSLFLSTYKLVVRVSSCNRLDRVHTQKLAVLTGLRECALLTPTSSTWLFRFPNPENISPKSPPRLKPKSLSALTGSFGGVAVLA
jgi:hypothetical protein